MPDPNEVLKSALSLPMEERAALADRLLASLASDSQAVAEKASRLFR